MTGRGGGGEAHTSPVFHSSTQQVGGELEMKIAGLLAGDQFLFYPELELLAAAGPASTGGAELTQQCSSGGWGVTAPSPTQRRRHIQPKELRDPQHKIKIKRAVFQEI